MIPYQALLTPLYLDFAKVGLVNTHLGLAIVHTILQLPFSVFLMRNSFEAIPREIEEAAMIDGCSAWRRLTHVFLPLAVPAIVTVALFAFINSWNEFLAALIFMNRETSFTVPILLVSVRIGNHGAVDWGALQASVIISIIPCLAVYLALAALLHLRPALGRGQMSEAADDAIGRGEDVRGAALTIRDVARLAGVSIGTASKAMNANGRLSAETREGSSRRERDRLPAEQSRAKPASRALDDRRHSLQRQLRSLRLSHRRGAGAQALRSRHRGLHVQRHRRSHARAQTHRAIAQ